MLDEQQDDDGLEALRRITADRLRVAGGNRQAIIAVIEQFLDAVEELEDSPAVIWDYFCISAPTIPEMAGYDKAAEDRIIRIFSTVTHGRWGEGQPLPADWPWHERDGGQ